MSLFYSLLNQYIRRMRACMDAFPAFVVCVAEHRGQHLSLPAFMPAARNKPLIWFCAWVAFCHARLISFAVLAYVTLCHAVPVF